MEYGEWRSVQEFNTSDIIVSSEGWIKTQYGGGFADSNGKRKLGHPRRGMEFKGHKVVTLHNKKYNVCELIATAFLGPCPTIGHKVFHRDGDVDNNKLSNLVWSTGYGDEYGEWCQVPGIDASKLIVSSLGFVRTRSAGGKVRNGFNRPLGKPTKGNAMKTDVMSVTVDTKQYLVHRLVALAFIGTQPSPKHTVDHIDRDQWNNCATNLRWATPEQQCANKGLSKPSYLHTGTAESQDNLIVDGETEEWAAASVTLRVSTMGRVQRRHRNSKTKWMRKATPPVNKRRGGYVNVAIADKRLPLHSVILRTFRGFSNDPTKTTVDHVNGIRHDNRLCNLCWATKKEQALNTVRGKRKSLTSPDL